MTHELPSLGYDFDALEPFIDSKTMEIHYGKHHKGYVDKLNAALEGHDDLKNVTIEKLIEDLNSLPEEIRDKIRNSGGGHLNHSFFWKILKKDIEAKGKIIEEIDNKFGSLDNFKEEFKKIATGVFGSGWAWLVYSDGDLELFSTKNQENPLTFGKVPIIGLDVWEHAYYLKHQNRRPEYIDDFFNVLNWEQIENNFLEASK